jgi:divinyl chlorophyllide a 8-vinyl-reductase
MTRRRVFVLGATGTIGRATVRALLRRGHEVVALVRPRAGVGSALAPDDSARLLPGATLRVGHVADPASLARDGFRGERFDALVSCLASRTGAPQEAWSIDHRAHSHALAAARAAGVSQVVLLSAICVQKPLLAFQQAKLAFERELIASGVDWSIVRPTAFFKSLSGQVERVKRGRPFLVFGDGRLTACKPISDDDLADYLAGCLDDPARRNRVLPIGGPGPAITPRQQGEHLFALLGRAPRFKQVPVDGVASAS